MRAGYGIFYDRFPQSLVLQADRLNGSNQQLFVVNSPSFGPSNIPASFAGIAGVPSTVYRIDSHLRAPYILQSAVGIEHQLTKSTKLSLTYLNARGVHQLFTNNINAPFPGTGIRPDPDFLNINQVESSGFLRSQALTVTWRGRVGRRFQPFAQYVLSKTTDNTSGTFWIPANNYDWRPETGPSDEDARHRFNMMGVITLPRGVQTGLVLSISSGLPYDIITGLDDNNDTVVNDRPAGGTRNTGRGPAVAQLDLRFSKTIAVLRVDEGAQPFFGRANVAAMARTVQFSARYTFRR